MQTSRSISEKPVKDIRTLCYPCFSDYHNAGYKLTKLNKPKSKCDKCNRQGCKYWLMSNKRNQLK